MLISNCSKIFEAANDYIRNNYVLGQNLFSELNVIKFSLGEEVRPVVQVQIRINVITLF